MKKLNLRQGIAVAASLAFLAYLLFSEPLLNFFNLTMEQANTSQGPQNSVTIEEISLGTGVAAQVGDMVTAHYVGTLADGRVFDSSRDRGTPISFMLGVGQVIRGWDEGIAGMRVGGKRVLTITPDYGYGDRAIGTIPANSTLIFEVELLDVEKSQ